MGVATFCSSKGSQSLQAQPSRPMLLPVLLPSAMLMPRQRPSPRSAFATRGHVRDVEQVPDCIPVLAHTQAKSGPDDLDLAEEDIRGILAGTEPMELGVDQELRNLERDVASSKAELDALRSQHEQVCAREQGDGVHANHLQFHHC